ncbi:MAG: VanW family protein [Christensenellaceae bacterium]|jgi:vancomycin resistance protein YoaR|nr:VanW family protein [Christensenellaceae bacterium]
MPQRRRDNYYDDYGERHYAPARSGGGAKRQPARGSAQRRASSSGSGPGGRRPGSKAPKSLILACLTVALLGVALFVGWRIAAAKQDEARQQTDLANQFALQQQNTVLLNQNSYYPGIVIAGVPVGGMTKAQALSALGQIGISEQGKSIVVEGNGQSYAIPVLSGSDVSTVLDEAWRLGREGSEEVRLLQIAELSRTPREFELKQGYSIWDLDAEIEKVAALMEESPVDAKIQSFDPAKKVFVAESGKSGLALERESLKALVEYALASGEFDLPIQAVLKEMKPAISASEIESAVLLKKFSTTFKSSTNRNENIRLCSTALSGYVVLPGEEFSINQITGERTPAKGYREAKVIKNGVYVEEPGGGVCQVSSTLFNAVIRAGLKVTERHNHTIKSTYVPESEDAAIDYPSKDFRFVNTSTGPVAVVFGMDMEGKKLTASLYGTAPLLAETESIELVTELISETPQPENQYKENPALAYGEEILVTEGRSGAKYRTFIVKKRDGAELSRELLHTSNYPAKASVYERNSSALPGPGNYVVPTEEPEQPGGEGSPME